MSKEPDERDQIIANLVLELIEALGAHKGAMTARAIEELATSRGSGLTKSSVDRLRRGVTAPSITVRNLWELRVTFGMSDPDLAAWIDRLLEALDETLPAS